MTNVSAATRSAGLTRTSAALTSSPVLRAGAHGSSVVQLQNLLRAKGFSVTADGSFGPRTTSAVKAFQASRHLTADGVVGPRTWAALRTAPRPPSAGTPTLKQGAKGPAVKDLQAKLNAKGGYGLSVDGDFGLRTTNAVKAFQRARGMTADGVVGPRTWSALNGTGGVTPPPPASGTHRVTGYVNGVPRSITVSSVGNNKYMRTDAASAFNRMKAAAARAGVSLSVNSGFRTQAEQQHLYNLYRQGRGNLAARPGYSNHQGGLSADISVPGGYGSSTYRWLQAHGGAYGFKNDVRGEPWHWTF